MNANALKLAAVLLGAALSVRAADPLIGTWKLDVSKSIFNPGPAPKSQIRAYQEVPGGGTKLTLTTIDVEGTSQSIDLPADTTTYCIDCGHSSATRLLHQRD